MPSDSLFLANAHERVQTALASPDFVIVERSDDIPAWPSTPPYKVHELVYRVAPRVACYTPDALNALLARMPEGSQRHHMFRQLPQENPEILGFGELVYWEQVGTRRCVDTFTDPRVADRVREREVELPLVREITIALYPSVPIAEHNQDLYWTVNSIPIADLEAFRARE